MLKTEVQPLHVLLVADMMNVYHHFCPMKIEIYVETQGATAEFTSPIGKASVLSKYSTGQVARSARPRQAEDD
jgi:hypothetical protein